MSTSPASSPSEGAGGVGEVGDEEMVGGAFDLGPRREGGPSASRRKSADAVFPEHFVEAVAVRVAVETARSEGRLAAAPAIAAVFQVCSTWRAASRSELLWEGATRGIWWSRHRSLPTWRQEFIRLHRTARNFRSRRSAHSHLLAASSAISSRRLSLSDHYLAAGFLDGSVRLFDLPSGHHLATYRTHPYRDRLGPFSLSISGLVLLPGPSRLVYACQDGDIHVAPLDDPVSGCTRRAVIGNLIADGTLVDFTGDSRWWVGLFAGVPGRSWHVWDADSEQLVYIGGSLTDPCSVLGWQMLTDSESPAVGRIRIAEPGAVAACISSWLQVMDLDSLGEVLNGIELRHGVFVDSVDACDGLVMVVDLRGLAKVLRARTLAEVCRFSTVERMESRPRQRVTGMVGCMNWGYAVVRSVSGLRVWDAATGEYLYNFTERTGDATVVVASDRYVAAWINHTGLHLWDFGAL